MREAICLGVPADWINSWLAAIGTTVLDARIRLHWSASGSSAILSAADRDPVEVLAESWPSERFLSELPISSKWRAAGVLERKINVDDFQRRARAARGHPQSWTLSSTITDLSVDENGEVAHAPFDPPGPGTIKWLHHRLQKIHGHVREPTPERIQASLAGQAPRVEGTRVEGNGLGFDLARIGSGTDKTGPWIDPVMEVMAFFGLALLPMRGAGFDGRLPDSRFQSERARQRCWRRSEGSGNTLHFCWPAWGQPLDMDGIDALLDAWDPCNKRKWNLIGVHSGWKSVAYKSSSRSDPTRAYGAERI